MLKDNYLGITSQYESLYKKGGSKFIGILRPIRSQEEVKATLHDLRQQYADATHVCYAYVLGINRTEQHFSDDGEPSNSAGRPILHQLLSSGMSFVFAAVVRYYGGKKLGIPGLIESYGSATAGCLAKAAARQLVLMDHLRCTIALDQQHLLYNFMNRSKSCSIEADGGEFIIHCPQTMTSELRSDLSKLPTLAWVK